MSTGDPQPGSCPGCRQALTEPTPERVERLARIFAPKAAHPELWSDSVIAVLRALREETRGG